MTKVIVLGQIPNNFTPDTHIPIHPICFQGKEHIYPNWTKLFDNEPYTKEEIIQIYPKLADYGYFLCEELGRKLNQKHQFCYSAHFWKIVLFPYIEFLLQTTWMAEKYVHRLLNQYRNDKITITLVKNQIDWQIQDMMDFDYQIKTHPFYFWLFSQIIQAIGLPIHWKIAYKEITITSHYIEPQPQTLKNKIIQKFDIILKNHFHYKRKIYGTGVWDDLFLGLLLRLKPPKKDSLRFLTSKTQQINSSLDLLKLTWELLPLYFRNKKHFERITNIKAGKLKVGSQALVWKDDYKIKIAHAVEQGARVLGVQHGGQWYGNAEYVSLLHPEYALNAFVAWGAQHHKAVKSKLISMPYPMLCRVANRHTQKNESIIYVTSVTFFSRSYFNDYACGWKYLAFKNQFLDNLNPNLHSDFWFRTYPYENQLYARTKPYYTKRYPWLQIHTGNLHKDLLKCKLLVLDHPGTTFNIAMAGNIPVIAFWHEDMIDFCAEYQPYLQKLREAKIIFHCVTDVLTHLSNIQSNVQEWWQSELVQEVKQDWCQKYALTDKNWRVKWLQLIWNF